MSSHDVPQSESRAFKNTDDLDGIDGGVCSTELEARLIRELIYAFQGIEGVIIKRKFASPERGDSTTIHGTEGKDLSH